MNFIEFVLKSGLRPHLFPALYHGFHSFVRDNISGNILYILIKNEEIVYIGKSDKNNFIKRISSHRKSKDFDIIALIDAWLYEKELLIAESGLITFIQPKYNKVSLKSDRVNVEIAFDFIYCGLFKPYDISSNTRMI